MVGTKIKDKKGFKTETIPIKNVNLEAGEPMRIIVFINSNEMIDAFKVKPATWKNQDILTAIQANLIIYKTSARRKTLISSKFISVHTTTYIYPTS